MLVEQRNSSDEQLTRAVLHMSGNITGLACGIVVGLGLFVTTLWLVIKGGAHVGAHLELLSQFFIGYTVTWAGSVVGLFYGFITGYLAGWTVATIYNRILTLKSR
jgi:predicted metal-binding membrane protein